MRIQENQIAEETTYILGQFSKPFRYNLHFLAYFEECVAFMHTWSSCQLQCGTYVLKDNSLLYYDLT